MTPKNASAIDSRPAAERDPQGLDAQRQSATAKPGRPDPTPTIADLQATIDNWMDEAAANKRRAETAEAQLTAAVQEREAQRITSQWMDLYNKSVAAHRETIARLEKAQAALSATEEALKEIDSWRYLRLGAHPSQDAAAENFDNGVKVALARCSDRARAALSRLDGGGRS